jgi:hypothetical protein
MAYLSNQTTPTEYGRLQADINKSFQALNAYIVRLENENKMLKKHIAENIALLIGTDYEEAKKNMRSYVKCWIELKDAETLSKLFPINLKPESEFYPPKEHFLELAAKWYIEEKIRNSDAEMKVSYL